MTLALRRPGMLGDILRDLWRSLATVLTNNGEDWAAQRLAGSGSLSTASGQYVHWGTGAGTAAKGDTDLFTPATEARVAGTVTVTGSGATAKWQNVATLTADGAKTITNAGAWSAAGTGSPPTGGTLFVKGDFTGIALALNDQIQFTVTIDPQ